MSEFKVDDKVTLNGSVPAVVRFGPAKALGDIDRFLVEQESNGVHRWVTTSDMTAIPPEPTYGVGDVVSLPYKIGVFTLTAGPFENSYGETWWAASKDGVTDAPMEAGLTLVRKGDALAILDGVSYDLTKLYRDREGDPWVLRRMDDGKVRGLCSSAVSAASVSDDDDTLEKIVSDWGPLRPE